MKRIKENPFAKEDYELPNKWAKEMAFERGVDAQLDACEKEHAAKMRELFEEIKRLSLLLVRFDKIGMDTQSYTEVPLIDTVEWQAIRKEYL